LKMEAIRSSETSVLITATRGHIPEDGILHSQRAKASDFSEKNCWSHRFLCGPCSIKASILPV
jgi:hypothetical protein